MSPGTDQPLEATHTPALEALEAESWKQRQSIRAVHSHAWQSFRSSSASSSSQRRKRKSQASVVLPWLAPPQLHKVVPDCRQSSPFCGGRGIRKPVYYPGSHPTTSTSQPMMQPRDSKRARLLPSATLDTLGNDLLIRCASYLDADGLAQLGRTSARFGIPQAGQQRSLANEAAHQRFRHSATVEERKCLPNDEDESDISLCRALESLRQPLSFDELAGGFGPQENPASVAHTRIGWSTAMSGHVMRGGRHFTEFTLTTGGMPIVSLGVIRPVSLTNGIGLEADWRGSVYPVKVSARHKPAVSEKLRSQRTVRWEDSNGHCCAYHCYHGYCYWTDWGNEEGIPNLKGLEGLRGSGTIGLLLDLNEGTLSVFKNGRRLGVMKDGLNGEYVWFVSVFGACTISMSKGRAPN